MITQSEKEALEEAINIIGGQVALARLLGIKQQSVSQWLENGVPYRRVVAIEKATKHKVSRYRLKPSFFEPDNLNN
jgi:DNA-binding transcriptional regulator YdaS (Cro superfamily)